MNRYVLSPAARADLEEIWDYTCQRWDDDQAEEYVREIQRAIERVVDNPMIGRACDELRPGYRKGGPTTQRPQWFDRRAGRARTAVWSAVDPADRAPLTIVTGASVPPVTRTRRDRGTHVYRTRADWT